MVENENINCFLSVWSERKWLRITFNDFVETEVAQGNGFFSISTKFSCTDGKLYLTIVKITIAVSHQTAFQLLNFKL